ncbi:EamA/RhaT family transporter [Phenylobacterium sp.]|uniref:EamA family transporter n=1 Tax=Phenylobacterium sp. TaxID=1871053 RepID=UPI002BD7341F|nr:EamA/RhaT family transporter [Phenylobacterium sp.]HLZ76790.1 EamA/RhaT family transporter [Phenylobacterium sp.]
MLWILLTAAAAPLQVARNALQRGLVGDAGPWGATLVRFLFGLPFSFAIFGVVALLTPGAAPHLTGAYGEAVFIGAIAQMGATAALLMAMRRAGFAVATVMQQSSLPLSAVFGWLALGDKIGVQAWAGIAVTTLGLAILSWPRRDQLAGAGLGSLLGLASGAAFAVALNAYRQAGLGLEPHHAIYAGTASVCVAQAIQSAVLLTALAIWRPGALRAVAQSWKPSLGAGFFGAAASACWFAALALHAAGPVRAVGVIEAPIAAGVGRRLFKETLSRRQLAGGIMAALGVVAAALG